MENATKRRSLSASLSIMVVVMILVSTVAVGILAYFSYRQDTINMHSERCLSIATTVAAAIDPEGMAEALETREKDAQWETIKAFADKVAVENDLIYLYITDSDYSTGYFTYYVEGWNPATGDPPIDFLYDEVIEIYADEAFVAIETGEATMTGIYDSSGEGFDFGLLVTGYVPVVNGAGKVVGLVGADISMEEALASVNAFMIRVIIIVAICIAVFTLLALRFINSRVRKPVSLVREAAEKLAMGDPEVDVTYGLDDEIGELFKSFNKMSDSIKRQIDVFKRIADGDLTVTITPRSDRDEMSFAMQATVSNLKQMLELFRKSAESLEQSSGSIAAESARVSKETNSEISVIDEIDASASVVLDNTYENASAAEQANALITDMADMAMQGSLQIQRMIEAVDEIERSYSSITKVVDSIDAIAFQTNILALNASVEAARAGQFGRGFAVVAEEVGNLASKSSQSARSTGELIEDALAQVKKGVEVSDEAARALEAIVRKIGESGTMLNSIMASSVEQTEGIKRIHADIARMGDMIRRTAASAESSADVADTLSGRAKQLATILEKYKL